MTRTPLKNPISSFLKIIKLFLVGLYSFRLKIPHLVFKTIFKRSSEFSQQFFIVFSFAFAASLIGSALYTYAALDAKKALEGSYPVVELGGCKSYAECRVYCNRDENIPKCNRYAIKHGLLTGKDAEDSERLLALLDESGLPGKCKGAPECFSYCESVVSTEECLDYAVRHNLVSSDPVSLENLQKIIKVRKKGVPLPGNCETQSGCEIYCEDLNHLPECVVFAEKSGITVKYDLEVAKKIVKAGITQTPGGCKGKEQCEAYCGDPSHLEECANFAEKIGMMTKEEAAMARKIARSGIKKFPGGCRSKEACDVYCANEANFEECVTFAEKAGFMSSQDVEFAKKTHGKTPGDCARGVRSAEEGKRACSAYCAKPENNQVCMDFAIQIGLITAEDAKELGGGGSLEDFNACLPHINEEMLKCFDVLGKDIFEKMKAGQLPDDPQDLKVMLKGMKEVRACMNKNTDEAFGKLAKDFPDAAVCLEKVLGENPIEKIKSGRISCREFPEMQEKIKSCFSGFLESQLDTCLSLDCSDVTACFNKLGGGKKADPSKLDPAIKKKISDKINSCTAVQINECLAKDCSEVTACFAKLQGGGSGGEKDESQLDPDLKAKITAKIMGCMKTREGDGGALPQGDFTKPSQQQKQDYKTPEFQTSQIPQIPGAPSQPQIPGYQTPQIPQYPQVPGGSAYEIPITPELCANFTNVPACSYAGSQDSQNYKLCKKCYPDR